MPCCPRRISSTRRRTPSTLSAISPPHPFIPADLRFPMMDPIAVPWEPRPGVPAAITVSQLARLIRETVRANPLLDRILVRGEVSNLQTSFSNHVSSTQNYAPAQHDALPF